MSRRRLTNGRAAALFALGCLACGPTNGGSADAPARGERSKASDLEPPPYAKVILDHRPYLMATSGPPRYRIELGRDGLATLEGRVGSERGDFVGKIGERDFARLCALIDAAGIRDLEDEYNGAVFHSSDYWLRIEEDDGDCIKEIYEYADLAPVEFWGVRSAIESLMLRIHWRLVDPPREPSGRGR